MSLLEGEECKLLRAMLSQSRCHFAAANNLQAYLEELGAFELLRCRVLDIPEVVDDGRNTSDEQQLQEEVE